MYFRFVHLHSVLSSAWNQSTYNICWEVTVTCWSLIANYFNRLLDHCLFSVVLYKVQATASHQGCFLGLDVSVSRPSRDVLTSRLGLISDKVINVSVSSRSRTCASRVSSRSRPKRSRRLVSGLGPFRLVETFRAGEPSITSVLQFKPVYLSP